MPNLERGIGFVNARLSPKSPNASPPGPTTLAQTLGFPLIAQVVQDGADGVSTDGRAGDFEISKHLL
jgi:hypothetical protein